MAPPMPMPVWHVARIRMLPLALLPVIATGGCASWQTPPPGLLAREGGFAMVVSGSSGHYRVRTLSVLKGAPAAIHEYSMHQCVRGGSMVRVRWTAPDISRKDIQPLCDSVARATRLPMEAAGLGTSTVAFQITLVSEGGGIWRHRPARGERLISLAFWFPYFGDMEEAGRRIVSTSGHEFHHLSMALADRARAGPDAEANAYLAGACTLLQVSGTLSVDDLPRRHDVRADPYLPLAARRSSQAGDAVRTELMAFMEEEERASGQLPSKRMAAHCRERLGFSMDSDT